MDWSPNENIKGSAFKMKETLNRLPKWVALMKRLLNMNTHLQFVGFSGPLVPREKILFYKPDQIKAP